VAHQVIVYDEDEIDVIARTDSEIHIELKQPTGEPTIDAVNAAILIGVIPMSAQTAIGLGKRLITTGEAVLKQLESPSS
jgi:hypothetical protein